MDHVSASVVDIDYSLVLFNLKILLRNTAVTVLNSVVLRFLELFTTLLIGYSTMTEVVTTITFKSI